MQWIRLCMLLLWTVRLLVFVPQIVRSQFIVTKFGTQTQSGQASGQPTFSAVRQFDFKEIDMTFDSLSFIKLNTRDD